MGGHKRAQRHISKVGGAAKIADTHFYHVDKSKCNRHRIFSHTTKRPQKRHYFSYRRVKTLTQFEIPVFDRRDTLPEIMDADTDWTPPRKTGTRGAAIRVDGDGPTIEWRTAAQVARITSNKYSGQAANDNSDWPLAKILRTEGNDHCLSLAERYRDLHETATRPTALVGKEADNLYVVENRDEDGKSKGVKVLKGKKASVDVQPRRNMAASVPKKWNGDWPILAAIDAKRELAVIRAKLAYVPKILDAFEWSVVDSLTLDEIGKRLGAGSKGARGEARARVFDGFGIIDRHWRALDRKAA